MSVRASGPLLVPMVRQTSYLDYQRLSESEIAAADRLIADLLSSRQSECLSRQTYLKVLIVLRERRREAQCRGDIAQAGSYDLLMRQLSGFYLESKLYTGKARVCDGVEGQYFSTLERLGEVENSYTEALEKLLAKRRAAVNELYGVTGTRLSTFDSLIPDELPVEATRLSADLLDLREREKHLLGSRRFDEAAQLHKEFRRRQHLELIRRREEYYLHLEKQRGQVAAANERKLKALQSDWERKIDHLKSKMETELPPLREAVARLFKKLVEAKTEYVGSDDPIVNLDPTLAGARATGNQFHAERARTQTARGLTPMSLVGTRRPLIGTSEKMSTIQLSRSMKRSITEPDGRRWP